MNLYRINYEGGEEAHYALITELTESKAIQSFKKAYGGQAISSVELIRENANATKEQERKAVEKIRAILSTLGPDSYTATALDGCLEIAESNIENDFGESMKDSLESANRKIASLEDKLAESEKDYEAAHAAAHEVAAQKDAEIEALQARIEALQKQVLSDDDLYDIHQLVEDREAEDERTMNEAADEIVKHADDPTSKEFTEAVCLHRTYSKRVDYYKSLRHRIEAVQSARRSGEQ